MTSARPSVPTPQGGTMDVDDLILVSVDDHLVEPPDVFEGRLAQKWVDAAPRLITREDGTSAWRYGDEEIGNIALNAVSGRPKEEYGMEPTSFDQLRRGTYDIDERVKDMDANGVLGSLCFPSFPQFCGQLFARTPDKEQALAMVQAYNDWHIDVWCGTHPGRFIPCPIPAIWDPEAAAGEVRRCAAKGAHAVTFSENPSKLGWPSIHSDHWDPFWRACEEEQVVVCLHIGSSSTMAITSPDAPIDVLISLTPINIVQAAADLIWSKVFRKFPNIRVALSEGGIGWVPYFLERIDYQFQQHHLWTGQDFGGRLPSEVFNEHVITCFIDDQFGLASREYLNMDNVTWECDYPHSDSTWPTAPEVLWKSLQALPEEEIQKVSHRNAMRHFSYDPFAHVPEAEATVSSLRAKAAGHDVSIQSRSHGTEGRLGTLATGLLEST
jgi:predicted TIM-barrel fold metal-dependent hydrolase